MNADRLVFRARVILSTTFRRRSSMVIWIVFTAMDSNVDLDTHRTPHQQVVSTLMTCFVMPSAAGRPWQVIEFTRHVEPITGLICRGRGLESLPFHQWSLSAQP